MKRMAFLTAAVVFACSVPGAHSQEKDIYHYYNAYRAAYAENDYQAYLENLNGAISLRPEHPGFVYKKAGAYAMLGRPDSALDLLERLSAAGLSFNASADSDLVTLWDRDDFNKISERFAANAEQIGEPETVLTLDARGLIAESVAYYSEVESWLISSVRQRKIVAAAPMGEQFDFSSKDDSLWGVFGIKVDQNRGNLWACTGVVPQMEGFTDGQSGTGVVCYTLETGKLAGRVSLPDDGDPHLLGDLIVAENGDVYATDSYGPRLYKLPEGAGQFELFAELGSFVSPQGLVFGIDETVIFVADYLNGICKVDLSSKNITIIDHAEDVVVFGIDGLYFYDNSLIAVQNGTQPNRVMRFFLNAEGTAIESQEILAANHPDFAEPTLGMLMGDEFYFVGSSQWGAVDNDGNLVPEGELKPHIIFKLPLN